MRDFNTFETPQYKRRMQYYRDNKYFLGNIAKYAGLGQLHDLVILIEKNENNIKLCCYDTRPLDFISELNRYYNTTIDISSFKPEIYLEFDNVHALGVYKSTVNCLNRIVLKNRDEQHINFLLYSFNVKTADNFPPFFWYYPGNISFIY